MIESKLDRRGFLKGTVMGAGALAMAGVNADEARAAGPPKMWAAEADVIVVGLGVAGAPAAIAAAEAGAKVLLLEKGPGPSGATPVSSGTVWLPLNPLQQHPDSVEEVVKYLTSCAKDQADAALIRTFAENTKETAEWLLSKIGLKATQPNRYDYHPSYPGAGRGRNFSSQGAGAGLMTVLINAAKERKVEIRTGIRARRLIASEQGRILGVQGENPAEAFKAARAVILCAGGFSANEAMKKSFLKVYPAYGQVPGLLGDGILMGMGAGAAVEGMSEFVGVTVMPVPGRDRGVRFFILSAPSCIMVNRKGQRFCNESADYDTVSASYYAYDTLEDDYANVPAWMIFDEQVRTKGPASPSPGWSKDNLEEVKRGWIKKADSLADLAAQTGINGQALAQTIDAFNQHAAQGKDPLFRRGEIPGTPGVAKLSGPPYYAIQVYPGLYDTAGGLKINAKSQVMNPFGEAIPGLYSAGTTSHMAIGFYYPNGGAAIGQPLVFGRIAGKTAAAEKPWS
jgi:flavocytochrome c